MDFEENMVEQTEAAEEEDFSESDLEEEEEDTSESLDSFTDEEEAADEEPEDSQGTSEPGWFQSRWNKNVGRLTAQIREEVRNEYENQIAPLRDRLLEMDAKELVKQGEFKSIERAKEYLQLKQGIQPTVTEEPAPQPRNENGQFASRQDAVQEATINLLADQADKITAKTGIDVIEIMKSDPNVRDKITSGEWDFYDVVDAYGQKPARRTPPAPTRSSNGAGGQSPNAIDSMSKEQFARLEKKIAEGARISLK